MKVAHLKEILLIPSPILILSITNLNDTNQANSMEHLKRELFNYFNQSTVRTDNVGITAVSRGWPKADSAMDKLF